MIFFFLAFNSAISQRFCVCQPDRPGAVCTLEKKCQNFKNEDQILLIENKRSQENKSYINISQILHKNRKEGDNQINLEFDIFGSLPSKPIIFDFTKSESIIKNVENMLISIKIKGNEWKQIIKITGIDSLSSDVWSNFTAYSISLSISDIAVLFDVDEKNYSSFAFLDTLRIQKSRLILPNKKAFTFNTRNLYTDTISSYSDFSGKIITNQMNFIDTQDQALIQNFQSPIEVKNLEDFNKVNRNIKESTNEDDDSAAENFQYTFCLSTKDHNERALEDQDCEMHSVPQDEDHYISVKSTNVAKIIAKAPANNIIRFFLTAASQNDPCSFILPQFENENHTIFFQVADPDIPTYLTLKSSETNPDDQNVNISFTSVATVNINTYLLSSFRNITLRNSQIIFADDQKEASVQNLVTDSQSISQFTGKLTVEESIEIRKTTPRRLNGGIFMSDNSTLIVPQVSNFPVILFKKTTGYGNFSISLCDDGEYIEMPFYFNLGLINVALSDNVLTITEPINITFRSDANDNFSSADLDKIPKINITTYVPSQGIRATFGSAYSVQWPRYSVFTFENLSPVNDTGAYPIVYLTINDGTLITEATADKSIFLFFNYLNIMLLSYETFGPFIHGVNKKYDKNCPSIPRPSFTNLSSTICYQTGVYHAGYATLDTSDILESLEFDSKKIFLGVVNGSIKFPSVSDNVVILTKSDSIEFRLNETGEIEKTKPFKLIPSNPITTTFADSFVNGFQKHEDTVKVIKFEHKSIDVTLRTTSGEPVPLVELDDPVQGVHFFTGEEGIPLDYKITDDSYKGSRIGPVVNVLFDDNIEVPQTAFLADEVTFDAGSIKRRVDFIYYNESVANYKFRNSIISFTNVNKSDSTVNFAAKGMTLENSKISQDTNSVKLNFDVNKLVITDLKSIPASSFSSPIIMHDMCTIEVSEISKILFGENSIKLYLNDFETATIAHIPSNPTSGAARSIKSSKKSTLADETPTSGFYVETTSNNKIDLEVNGSSLPEDFQLMLKGDDPTVVLDKSFNNIKVPDNFEILADGKYNIDTDLRELPDGIGQGAVNVNRSKQKLTNNMAFIIFIIIFAVIFLVAIILCVVGLTCMPEPEQYDMSSNGGIFDVSDEPINKGEKEGEIDKSSDGVTLNDDSLEDIQQDENKKEEEVKKEEAEAEPTKAEAVNPNDSYSVEIDQEENTESLDNYFDEIDKKSEEKNNK